MKDLFTCLRAGALGLWVACAPVAGADDAIVSAKAVHSLLLGVAHAGPRLVVVGDRGHILYSDDQGRTWTQARVPTRQMLTAVFFVDAQYGWAVGHDAQILASEDGGVTWTRQYEDLKRQAPLLDLWFKDRQQGFAVGAYGALLSTDDGGQHWEDIGERLDNSEQLHLNAITAVKDAGLFIVGEQGSMFRSANGGQTWETMHSPYAGSLFGVIATARPETLLAYGLRGNLLRSTDFGATWQRIPLAGNHGALEFGLAGASLLADGSLVVVGNGGTVLRSHDDGQTFSLYSRPDRQALAAVTGADLGHLVLAGQSGVERTADNGAGPAATVAQP
ncbi:YCF48-related protein [Pseudomonas sp. dw_358]|uniref:WD40/YVTN/BNR-like repeat-containing protein n=1 Tax=Pseudomonas sp. dw_358 TaxID=2720083 RepID=UPI001BD1F454|nr:YCF48-related protein [Pseudomonas sp. dw_358]